MIRALLAFPKGFTICLNRTSFLLYCDHLTGTDFLMVESKVTKARTRFIIPCSRTLNKFILEKYRLNNPVKTEGTTSFGKAITLCYILLRLVAVWNHGSGRKPGDGKSKNKLRKATRRIKKLFPQEDGSKYEVSKVEDYSLPIDGVLEKMKDQAIEFVRSSKH